MPVVEEAILIRAPQKPLFDLAQDYRLRLKWDPYLLDLRFLDGAREAAVGVRVWVKAWTGLAMVVEYVVLDRPETVAMKMVRGPFILRKFAGSWRFHPHPSGATEVIFRYVFETRWPWLRWLLDPVIRWTFGRDIRKRLSGLKRGVEESGLLDDVAAR
jgi:ribosome-associated toxin RatA of RatAB toxin-antitoxin module